MVNRGGASTSGSPRNKSRCISRAFLGIFLALGGMYAGVGLQLLLKAKEDPKKSLGGYTDKKGIDNHTSRVI